jgi:thiol-disulfide isomerase/thioredoxin
VQKQYLALVPNNDFLADANAEKRDAVAAEAVPLLKELIADLDAMTKARPVYKWQIFATRQPFDGALYAFGDPEFVERTTKQAELPGREGLRAKRTILRGQWYRAGQDAAKQEPVLAAVEQLAQAQPGDLLMTALVDDIRSSATDPDVQARMVYLLTDTLDNMQVDSTLAQIKAHDKVHSFEGKPMVISGKLSDGSDFTTEKWKGKVILVDFWAVWCAPCVAELPRVKKVYAEYHDKGFEVLGIDNDDKLETLKKFTAAKELPWPQLYDADASAKQKWHPVTTSFGINGIPVMFLIDKKGICRTVTARDDFEKLIPQLLAE